MTHLWRLSLFGCLGCSILFQPNKDLLESPSAQTCIDQIDNDDDGETDCADPVCFDAPECVVCGDGNTSGGEQCDDGNLIDGDGCDSNCLPSCGNGRVDPGEACDNDSNVEDGNCRADCTIPGVVDISSGILHSCARLDTGHIRCWGQNDFGQLGYGNTNNIGDDERPSSAGDIPFGPVQHVFAGGFHSCAQILGSLHCWGRNDFGQLGYGDTQNVGDDESVVDLSPVKVGGEALQVSLGELHSCALLVTGNVRCWGNGDSGRLGYGNIENVGDNENPEEVGDVNVGGVVVQIAAGDNQTCALLDNGNVRCWGLAAAGQLGYGNVNNIGDNEDPASAGDVPLGELAAQIDSDGSHTCARLQSGNIRCWGGAFGGQLGYGNLNNIGDDETPASVGDVSFGGTARRIALGDDHSCVITETPNPGAVRCWGASFAGQLGYGSLDNIGDDELPSIAGEVTLGGAVLLLVGGVSHTCALLQNNTVACWGDSSQGQLGYGNTERIGDNELPIDAGVVRIGGQ